MRVTKVFVLLVILYMTVTQVSNGIYSEQLLEAAAQGNIEVVRNLANTDNCDINVVNETGCSPLMLACRAGYVQVVDELLKQKANVHIANESGKTALLLAVEHGDNKDLDRIDIVKQLLKADACVDVCDCEGNTPLSQALSNTALEVVQELVAHGARIVKKGDGLSSIATTKQRAISNKQEHINNGWLRRNPTISQHFYHRLSDIFTRKMSSRVNIKMDADYLHERLLDAAATGDIDVVRDCIAGGCDANIVNEAGFSPLMLAARSGHAHIVELLLQFFANVHIQNRFGETALLLAAGYGDGSADSGRDKIIKRLLDEGAYIHECDKAGNSVLSHSRKPVSLKSVQEVCEGSACSNFISRGATDIFAPYRAAAYNKARTISTIARSRYNCPVGIVGAPQSSKILRYLLRAAKK